MTKNERIQRALKLLEKIHETAQEQEQAIFAFGHNAYAGLTVDCLKLVTKINNSPEDVERESMEYIPEEADIFELERRYADLKGSSKKWLIIWGIISFVSVGVILKFYGGDIQKFLTDFFGVKDTSKYIVLGIAGAVIYFVTEGFTKGNGGGQLKEGEITFQALIAQIAYAVIIPVVIVVLFFSNINADGGSASGKIDLQALLCFASGYSSKLVVMLLNKIVEKGEQIIKTL